MIFMKFHSALIKSDAFLIIFEFYFYQRFKISVLILVSKLENIKKFNKRKD